MAIETRNKGTRPGKESVLGFFFFVLYLVCPSAKIQARIDAAKDQAVKKETKDPDEGTSGWTDRVRRCMELLALDN